MCETFWRDSRFVIQTAFDGLQLKRERRATSLRQYPSVRRIGPESPMMYTSNSVTFLNPIRRYKANEPGRFLLACSGRHDTIHRTGEQMSVNPCIEGGLLLVMIVAPARIIWGRFRAKKADDKSPRGVGVRIIQLVSLFVFGPLIGILTIEGKLTGETAGALIGVAIGYTLSGVERAVPSNRRSDSPQTPASN